MMVGNINNLFPTPKGQSSPESINDEEGINDFNRKIISSSFSQFDPEINEYENIEYSSDNDGNS